jgi:hypothetical protein
MDEHYPHLKTARGVELHNSTAMLAPFYAAICPRFQSVQLSSLNMYLLKRGPYLQSHELVVNRPDPLLTPDFVCLRETYTEFLTALATNCTSSIASRYIRSHLKNRPHQTFCGDLRRLSWAAFVDSPPL